MMPSMRTVRMLTRSEHKMHMRAPTFEWWYEQGQLPQPTFNSNQANMDENGTPGLYYYDSSRALAFHWDGNHDHQIQVSQGGDHEPPHWGFLWKDHRPEYIIAGTLSLCLAFGEACRNWVDAKEDAA